MHKLTKQILTGVVALGLLAPVATQSLSNSPRSTVQAKSRWHYGVPKSLKGDWQTNLMNNDRKYHHGYVKNCVRIHKNSHGFNPWPLWYNSHKQFKKNGNANGMFWDPHYKYVGHNTYKIICGAMTVNGNKTHSLKSELHYGTYITYTIHKHGHNHFSAWENKLYQGYFHRV